MIKIREKSDPYQMLKFINPKEAQLMDKSQGLHIRFRLGGDTFPPTIYYKIFIHQNMVDMNAFSPRNYTLNESKAPLPQTIFLKKGDLPKKKPSDAWYQRQDGNEWRPVLETNLQNLGSSAIVKENPKKVPFHHEKLCRRETLIRKRKEKQLEWMKMLYQFGKEEQSKSGEGWLDLERGLKIEKESMTSLKKKKVFMMFNRKPRDIDQEIDRIMQDLEFQEKNQSILTWTQALDFESYHTDWLSLAATAPSNREGILHTDNFLR